MHATNVKDWGLVVTTGNIDDKKGSGDQGRNGWEGDRGPVEIGEGATDEAQKDEKKKHAKGGNDQQVIEGRDWIGRGG